MILRARMRIIPTLPWKSAYLLRVPPPKAAPRTNHALPQLKGRAGNARMNWQPVSSATAVLWIVVAYGSAFNHALLRSAQQTAEARRRVRLS